jgi:hypothetical protein
MKITNEQNLPSALYDALVKDEYEKVGDFSATELIGPPRIRVLKKVFYGFLKEDCSDHIFRLFGSVIHETLNLANVKNALQEERLTAMVNGSVLSGAPDLYDHLYTLWDFKVTSRWVATFGPKSEWEEQLNIYDYLLDANGFAVKKAKVCAIFRDWSKTQAAKDPGYPQRQVKVFPVKLWTKEEQLGYIEERIQFHLDAEQLPIKDLPRCTPEERWEKPTKYAVMKKGRKSAVRVFDNQTPATHYLHEKGLHDDKNHWVQVRPGESTRCEYYCMVKDFCNQYQETIKEKKK